MSITVTRTLKIPVHYGTTDRKRNILDNLTARLTYAARLLNQEVKSHVENGGDPPATRSDIRQFSQNLGEETGISSGHVQQVEDKVLWGWKQYREAHREWKWRLEKATGKWRKKLKNREPGYPFTSKRSQNSKIPVWLDTRTGELQKTSDLDLTQYVIHISTLRRGETIDVLLNPCEWHKEKLEEADNVGSFEIVWSRKREKFMVHVRCDYEVPENTQRGVAGIDLGLSRPAAAVLSNNEGFQFQLHLDRKLEKLQELNDRVAHLRREEKYGVLKKLRRKRRNVARHLDRLLAKQVAHGTENHRGFVGHPAYIRHRAYRGNGDRTGRKLLQNWSFSRQARFIEEEKAKLGDRAETVNEWRTSSKCCRCGAKVERPTRSRIQCPKCGYRNDAEFNGCVNIASKGIEDSEGIFSQKTPERVFESQERDKPDDQDPLLWVTENSAGAAVDTAQNGR